MANKDLFKQAIAEAKSVREAAIANAKQALEETLTPHLKDMLAAKLQEMEDSSNEEEEGVEENASGFIAVKEAEDDSEESEDEAEEEAPGYEAEESEEEELEGDQDLSDLSVDQFKDMIRDIIAQEIGSSDAEMGDDMDAGDIEGMGDEPAMEEPGMEVEDEEEIDLDELLRELEYGNEEQVSEKYHKSKKSDKEDKMEEELKEALNTIKYLKKDLQEVNLLNSKLLYVNKIFKANSLTESQKVNIIAAFDKAETVKEVKLVFETVSENVVNTRKENVTESKFKGMASKATGTTASKPEIISEVSDAVRRMQKLAGIIK
jgi:hypothetical protein